MLVVVVDQVLVHLVGEHEQVVLAGQFGDRRQVGAAEHGAGRVVRGVDHEHPGARCDGRAQAVEVEHEAVAVGDQVGGAAVGTRQRDGGGVGVVVGLDEHHLLAGFDQPEQGGADRLGRADRHQHLGVGVVLGAVTAGAVGRDRPAQHRHAAARRVLVDAVGDGLPCHLEHPGGAVGVREALAEVHRLVPDREFGHPEGSRVSRAIAKVANR
ncbi:Uncharacterised protein [Mycobacteroides abscessus subsp. abscessus]|nr:Uncharacterised protein [Mycobacteroides abscessus subsp. abscessus]